MGRLLQLAKPLLAVMPGNSSLRRRCCQHGTSCRVNFAVRPIWLVSLCVIVILLASCGGDRDKPTPTDASDSTISSESSIVGGPTESPDLGRPTLSPDELTALAEITRTPVATNTAAAGSDNPLAISTVSQHECNPEGDETGAMDLEQYLSNFECIIAYYPWPLDRQIDMDAYRNYFSGDPVGFMAGYQYAGMNTFNTCAWYETWLDAFQAGNDARAADALDIMLNFIPNYATLITNYPVEDLGTGENDLARAEVAALGDPTQIQDYVNVQCSWLPDWQE